MKQEKNTTFLTKFGVKNNNIIYLVYLVYKYNVIKSHDMFYETHERLVHPTVSSLFRKAAIHYSITNCRDKNRTNTVGTVNRHLLSTISLYFGRNDSIEIANFDQCMSHDL